MTEEKVTWGKWIGSHLLLAAAALCFLEAVYLLYNDKPASGAVAAGLFVVLLLLRILPELESLKAFGIEAVLRRKVQEVEEVLKQLRATVTVFGNFTYHTLGWGSRWDQPIHARRQLADELDALLASLGIAPAAIAEMKRDYIALHVRDLKANLVQIATRNLDEQRKARKAEKFNRNDTSTEAMEARYNARLVEEFKDKFLAISRDVEFGKFCDEAVPRGLVPEDDERALIKFAADVRAMGEECLSKGKLTENAAQFLTVYSDKGLEGYYVEVFGRNPR